MRQLGSRTFERVRLAGFLVGLAALLVFGWLLLPSNSTVESFSAWFAPHRQAWYAPPVVAVTFAVLGVLLVPVLLLVAATGVAFGPWLGPPYAMIGCLTSASTGFAIGRWIGLRRVERFGGRHIARVARMLADNGTLAVFLLRKIPMPFLLANVIAGAADVRYRDFLLGTLLGMTALVIGLAGFGYQATHLLDHPSPRSVLIAAAALGIPLSLAWWLNRALRRRVAVGSGR
jgi:uncharacterized membrane protein YdjX (TVP38/TMEM64 family)